ncbi:MAG: TonB-dependent receptor [Prolixibacteraceae bacterium]|jgi:TonB-linked SusC/RagA family outer membrane protein|nr:TonB-dependent receptor [Bacteroidota bacterium]HNZ67707.1 TonB-dependent receptor [Prolixibacteraceae bacterium]HOC85469.1 TonB-dependent receptor [Prolixibacteraceae bacterium]HOG94683.1 TonB-dependent receptor [Prolixibacteraceae bacterium]HOY91828.1 TonB-dependent receptor [Prolixibacteraceae bacterium]
MKQMNRGRIFPWVQFAAKFWVPWLAIFLLMVPVLQLSAKGHSLKGDTRAGSTEQAVTENQITPVAESAWPGEVTYDSQQPARRTIRGKITDQQGAPLPGVTITILGTTRGVITDNDGSYSIDVASTDRLVYSFIGLESQIVDVGNQTTINVTMKEKTEELEDVTVVAFAKQKKESVLASIETVKPEELRVPSSNLTTALAGRMSGIISYQRSGEPGQDNAEFFIRGVTTFGYKKDPLILIDGIELSSAELSRLHPDDIAAFSIMKDATATALYGARGANGVILVTTKEGREGKAKVNIRWESSMSQPTKNIELADPITYMKLHNEAVRTRDPLGELPYSPTKVDNTIAGTNPYVYPATDWQNLLLKDYTMNHRLNFNISGGGTVARYYISGGITQDNGILEVPKENDFNNNIDLKKYVIRSNVNINLTKTTEVILRVHGNFDDYRGPIRGGTETYQMIMRSNPVLFPAYYAPDEANKYVQHILFGNFGNGNYINPYAEMVKGYKESSTSMMLAQFELKQDLKFITEGLHFRLLGNTTRDSYFDVQRSYAPFFYYVNSYNNRTDEYKLRLLNSDSGREYLDYLEGQKEVASTFYAESALDYDRTFGEDHTVSGLLVGIMRQYLKGNAGDLQRSLPSRNLGLSGRFTYAYQTKYFVEFNFGYNGTERFSANERFGFFPSAGVGWYISKEKFWEPLLPTFSKLKLKATYGLVGNDAIGSDSDRFFYLSNVNLNDGNRGFKWGADGGYSRNGVSISRYANDKITWETATKTNLGVEVGLFDKIDIEADFFTEYRTNILMDRLSFSTFGLQAATKANVGEASSRGIDASIDVQHNFNKDLWLTARGNFTYAKGIYEKVEEPDYSATPWKSRVGQPITQQWGYIAERLFVDDKEVANSPRQELGSIVMGGDLKYRDINNDDRISSLDQVPIGFPTTPEIIYGFGASMGYKSVDLSLFFQGSARSSFWIDASATSPFVDNDNNYLANNALLKAYADSHWSEANRDIYALWPRLSYKWENNNLVRNTWYMQDGTFLRLKSVELGYSLPKNLYQRFGIEYMRLYGSGTNLLTFSRFKLWDPEMGGNGLGYPVQRVLNIGLQISF